MPFHDLTQDELRSYCRGVVEALEYWLRRLVDQELTRAFGSDFLNAQDEHGNNVANREIRESITSRFNGSPDRYARPIDAALLDDVIDLVCNPRLFARFFQAPLQVAYPNGRDEARTFLKRLVEPRNRLSHANPISIRQAEQIVCYSGDVIDSIKQYYLANNMSQSYNAPTVIKIEDSFGHSVHDGGIRRNSTGSGFVDFRADSQSDLRPGDTLSVEVEADPSFEPEGYEVSWAFYNQDPSIRSFRGNRLVLDIENKHVKPDFVIYCKVTSNLDWHRLGDCDDRVSIIYRILPPL